MLQVTIKNWDQLTSRSMYCLLQCVGHGPLHLGKIRILFQIRSNQLLRMLKLNFLPSEFCSTSNNQLLRFNSSRSLSYPTSAKAFWISVLNFLDALFFHLPPHWLVLRLSPRSVQKSFLGPCLFLPSLQSILFALLAAWLLYYNSLCCEKPLTPLYYSPRVSSYTALIPFHPNPYDKSAVCSSLRTLGCLTPLCSYFCLEP